MTFTEQLEKNVRRTVRGLKRDGVVGMGLANLRQITPYPSSNLDGAPRGTNAQYFCARLFDEAARKVAGDFVHG